MEDTLFSKQTGLTNKYVERINKMSHEELLLEYIYYATRYKKYSSAYISIRYMFSGVWISFIIYYSARAIHRLTVMNLASDKINSLINLVLILGFVLVMTIIIALHYVLRTIDKNNSRYLYLSHQLEKKVANLPPFESA